MIHYNYYYWGPILFNTKITQVDLDNIKNLCSKDPVKNNNKHLAGDIKHEYLINEEKINDILKPYTQAFRHCFKNWYNRSIPEIKASKAWVNYMQPGDYNPLHLHLRCDFSSVIYLKVPKELQKELEEYKGTDEGPGSIAFFYGEHNPYFISWNSFKPQTGDLFIFPSALRHSVNPYKSKCERISVSVNFTIQGAK